ncbi:MAG: hypothetical protein SFU25_04405, partial [Candidatus Caenarcaniphilales bacterium]|nr:hypothetical protein [Candidatus Caenarcaniphilales bacterium]
SIVEFKSIVKTIKLLMWEYASFDRNPSSLSKLINELEQMESKLQPEISLNPFINQLKNYLLVGKLLAKSALHRQIKGKI